LGTFPKNVLKDINNNKLKKDFATIINLDGDGPGTHWVMVCKKGDELLYFDSFGVEFIDSNIMDFINRCKCYKRYMNESQIQDYDSILCGYYCCKVIKNIFIDNINLKDCVKMFKERPSDINKDLADNLHI